MFIPRLCSSIVLLLLFFCSVFVPGLVGRCCFTVLAAAGAFLSIQEFCRLLKNKGMESYPVYTGIFMTAWVIGVLYLQMFFNRESASVFLMFLLLFPVVFACSLWWKILCAERKIEVLNRVLVSAAAFFLFLIPFTILAWLYSLEESGGGGEIHKLFFYLVIGTKIGDIGAYVTGSLSNKITKGKNHKLIPSISPGKSWEGLFGGLIISIVFSLLVFPWAFGKEIPFWISLIFGTVLFFGGAAGDLAESSLKRMCEIKDSGNIIPGIGGVLDLVDSLLLNTPIFSFMYWLLVLYY